MFRINLIKILLLLGALVDLALAQRTLRMLGLQPMTGQGWVGGGSCVTPSLMAIEDINARTDILNGYTLEYDYIDSQCNPGLAVYRMMQALEKRHVYNMVLGAACSTVSEATAQVSYLWNITQLSFGSSSPALSNRKTYPMFFRIGLPDQKHANARLDLLGKFNWKKVATLHQALQFFSMTMEDFVLRVYEHGDITITTQEIFLQNPMASVRNLKHRDARIIITAMYENMARQVICAAYKVGLFGPKMVWILLGWYSKNWWMLDNHEVECTVQQMSLVVEGAFSTSPIWANMYEERGVANVTPDEFHERFINHPKYDARYQSTDFVAYQCYDHIWLAALAFNCTIDRMQQQGHPKTLDEFTYADGDINAIVYECMSNNNLVGVSGRVRFTVGGDPDRIVSLERIQGGVSIPVGYYRQDLYPSYYEWIEDAIQWKDGVIPRDSTYTTIEEVVIPPAIYITMCSLAALGILLAVSFFTFNIIYKDNRTVKMSSPNINNILLLGCVVCYCSVFIDTMKPGNGDLCKARIMSFTLGFTTTFGSLFSKTWRVYRIFTNKKLLRRTIRDRQLIVIIGLLVAVVLTVLTVWELTSPHEEVELFLKNEEYTVGNDAVVRPFVRVCYSKNGMYFEWTLYILEGALLSFGVFLAWETRKVTIEALNDSHQIGMCLYNVVILSTVGLTLSLLLNEHVVMMYGVISGCIIIGTTITQMVVFIPKLHAVFTKVDRLHVPMSSDAMPSVSSKVTAS